MRMGGCLRGGGGVRGWAGIILASFSVVSAVGNKCLGACECFSNEHFTR